MSQELTTRASAWRRRTLVAAALLAVSLTAVPAALARPAVGRRVGGGARADVHDVRDPANPQHTVVKVLRPGAWEKNRLRVRSPKSRQQHVEASKKATRELSSDAAFKARFGDIVNADVGHSTESTWLLRRLATGTPFAQLTPASQRIARREMKDAVKMARTIVSRGVNGSAENFLFDPASGRIQAWFSVIQQPRGTLVRDLERTQEAPIGEGVNMVAYRATVRGKPKIVKIMKFQSSRREPEIATEVDLAEVTDALVSSVKTLRTSPEIIKRFGADVIPATESPAPGVVIVDEVKGVPFSSLGFDAQQRATNEVAELVTIARRLLPQHLIAGTKEPHRVGKLNFLFHADGRVAGWFDHISDSKNNYGNRTR
jgi:hypothetical protein